MNDPARDPRATTKAATATAAIRSLGSPCRALPRRLRPGPGAGHPPEAHSGNGGNQYLPPGPRKAKSRPLRRSRRSPATTPTGAQGNRKVKHGAAAHGELPLKASAGQYGPPAGAHAPADDYGPRPRRPRGISARQGRSRVRPAFGPGGPSGHGGHGGLGGHGGHGGPAVMEDMEETAATDSGHGGHGGQGPAPSDDYGRLPCHRSCRRLPLLTEFTCPRLSCNPVRTPPTPHPTAIGGGGRPQLALAPSFLPAPPVHNARPSTAPRRPSPTTSRRPHRLQRRGAFLAPRRSIRRRLRLRPGPSVPTGPFRAAARLRSRARADLDVIKSVTVYTDSQSSAQHSLVPSARDVYNGDAKQVHLVPDDTATTRWTSCISRPSPGSIIRNEEHPSQGLSKKHIFVSPLTTGNPLAISDHLHVITGNEDRQPSQSVLHQGQGIKVPTRRSLSAPGTQGVLMSPGVQSTSAPQHVAGTQGTQSSFSTPTRTRQRKLGFVSFQHRSAETLQLPPPSLLNSRLPPRLHSRTLSTSRRRRLRPSQPSKRLPAAPPTSPPSARPPVSYLNPPRTRSRASTRPRRRRPSPPRPRPPAAESHPRPRGGSGPRGRRGRRRAKPPNGGKRTRLPGRLLPPPPPRAAQPAAANDGKRTKQIQIIVPYTSSKDLIQFRFPGASPAELDASGWSPIANPEPASNQGRIVPGANNCSDIIADGSIDSPLWQEQAALCRAQVTTVGQSLDAQDDYHLHQESRRVTAKAPLGEKLPPNHKNKPFVAKPGSQTGEIQHIFASNIRDLLRGEEEAKPTADSINLLKLQKNIDEWTAQEFSKHKHLGSNHKTTEHDKGFTASFATGTTLHHLRLPSKQIPEEYLTTTPLSVDDTDPTDLFSPTLPPTYKINDISRTSPSSLFFDHEVSGSHTHSITANVVDKPENKSSGSRNKSSNDATWKFFESNLVLPEAVTVTTTTQIATTTDEFTAETTDTTEPTIQANWDHLEVSISPITKEKVYVVTPLSTWVAPSPSTTPSSPRFTSSGIYQALSRGPTSPRPSPTSINDIIPFRKSVLSPADMLGVTPLPFHSPRFLIRPTPGPSLHRLFTMKASEAGYTPPSPSPPLDARSHAPAHPASPRRRDADAATAAPRPSTRHSERESSTPAADNSTASRSRGAATLLGLTDLPTYTPPDGARVHTFSGHSKVVTVVTPPTLVTPKKKPAAGFGDKKATTSAASKTASATATATATATAITTRRALGRPRRAAPPAGLRPRGPPAGGDARRPTPRKEPRPTPLHIPSC
ncbi:Uncharacterized protein GBIM_10071 [Gryllus bimaculatus]|nr:Uncharacterized protein GBIM_10071 [Gryllus bimaculatus]